MASFGKVDGSDPYMDNDADRRDFALNLKEGLTPEAVIEDWGDYASDTREREETRTDVHFSSEQETEEYYNSLRRDTFRLTNNED